MGDSVSALQTLRLGSLGTRRACVPERRKCLTVPDRTLPTCTRQREVVKRSFRSSRRRFASPRQSPQILVVANLTREHRSATAGATMRRGRAAQLPPSSLPLLSRKSLSLVSVVARACMIWRYRWMLQLQRLKCCINGCVTQQYWAFYSPPVLRSFDVLLCIVILVRYAICTLHGGPIARRRSYSQSLQVH